MNIEHRTSNTQHRSSRTRPSALLIVIALLALLFTYTAFAQDPTGTVPPATGVPADSMLQTLVNLFALLGLGKLAPTLIAVAAWIGSMRVIAKQFNGWIQGTLSNWIKDTIDELGPTAEADMRAKLNSTVYRIFAHVVDTVFSLKLPTADSLTLAQVSAPAQNTASIAGKVGVWLVIGSLAIGAAAFAGCAGGPVTAAFKTERGVAITVETVMGAWNDWVGQHHPGVAAELKVKAAYEKYQSAQVGILDASIAYVQAQANTNSVAGAALSSAQINLNAAIAASGVALADLTTLVRSFGVKV